MEPRPVVHCFVGRLKSGGKGVRGIRRVTLCQAAFLMDEGWRVIGPDPGDLAKLAQWERSAAPFNQPRMP